MTPMELARSRGDALIPLARSYAAAIYGGRAGEGTEAELLGAEWWLYRSYDRPDRIKAGLNPKSLLR